MDPHINPATGVWDDNYYANIGSKLDAGGGGEDTVDSILSPFISSIADLFKKVKPYEEANPFAFDEVLAREASTAEYSPYYKEFLSDYVAKAENTKSRSNEDTSKLLDLLSANKDYFTGRQRRLLDQAERNVNEGYAGRGLYLSGARGRDINEMRTENKELVKDYMTGYEYQKTGAETTRERTLTDVNLAQSQYTRDIGRQEKTAIEAGVLQRKGETLDEYEVARQKYYQDNYGQNGGYFG